MPELNGVGAADVFGIAITVALTFVLGLEREEAATHSRGSLIAGVRTIPIIGLFGHALGLLSAGSMLPVAIGAGVVGAFLVVGYWHDLQEEHVGLTSKFTALVGYMVGALVAYGRPSAAAALTVATVLLLTEKQPLRRLAARMPAYEIATFVTFLLLAGVILPILPNQELTRFALNPFKIWLMVVAVSGISYASYLLQKVTRSDQSLLLTGLLGGLYSSTATTVAVARRPQRPGDALTYAGAIVLATGSMYIRILIVVWAFAGDLAARLAPALIALALVGSAAGVAMILVPGPRTGRRSGEAETSEHPLEVSAALLFAALFVGLTVATELTAEQLGHTGLMVLAVLVGITDILPFILSLAGRVGENIPFEVAATAVMVSIASNNVVKGVYAVALANRRTGVISLAALIVLAVLSVLAHFLV